MDYYYVQILSVLLLIAHPVPQCAAQHETVIRYIEKRILGLEDRLYKCEQDIQQYVQEFKELVHKMVSRLDNLSNHKVEVRNEMENLWARIERAEWDIDYLESTVSSNTHIEFDEHLVEKQVVEKAKEKKKLQLKSSTSCTTMLAQIKSQKTMKKAGGTIGAWMKNTGDNVDNIYFFTDSINNVLLEFANTEEFTSRDYLQKAVTVVLPFFWQGTGLQVYNDHVFFHRNGTVNEIIKYNIQTNVTQSMNIEGAGDIPPYELLPYTKIDLAMDEQGLWAIHGNSTNGGNIALTKIDHNKMVAEHMWSTTCNSHNAEAAFVICGTLYVMYNSPSGGRSHIDCIYDTSDLIDSHEIPTLYFPKRYSSHSSVHYNPRDQNIYAWDDGYQIVYKYESRKKLEHM
ncbi:olfactomedin-like protein 1 isoform X1 [Bufo gargarizans]|uniref:olfactomedin-like protein 1 isoform X1 n=1 Tax=Bufo gargarizans TaxID=30331 RepID=UPI001CF1DB06|nr:olfactomedin-like protein 1 isoform X1 [Bufo gargarizans]